MNQAIPPHKFLLRAIAAIYLLLFIGGLASAGYLLNGTVALTPIPLVGLLKYILLCILFIMLLLNTVRALTLRPADMKRLWVSTRNFKWLFAIAAILCITAWLGLFNLTGKSKIIITPIQITVLLVLAVFCFWSDSHLQAQTDKDESNHSSPGSDQDKNVEA